MKHKVISPKTTMQIRKAPPPEPVFDKAKIEEIDKSIIHSKYAAIFGEHKDKILDLVISRLALDSVLTSVQSKLGELSNGNPIEIVNKETNDKLDGIFDEALLVYAFDAALSKVLMNEDARKEFLLRYTEKRPGLIGTVKPGGGPLGSITSKNPEHIKSTIDTVEKLLKEAVGERDNAPSPYGHGVEPRSKRDSPSSKVLPTAGTLTRKGRRRRTT
jgi:hypothetical protein